MDIVGDDLGYSDVKTHTRFMCQSRITEVEPLLGHRRTIEMGGKRYYVGVGNGTVDVNKINSEITKVLLTYSLCVSSQSPVVRVVTGLPLSQFKEQRDSLRAMVMACSGPVVVNGVRRELRIEDCIIHPQGVHGNGLSVDIGGRTTDVAYVENGHLLYAKTIYDGMIPLSGRIINAINAKYGLALPDERAWSILDGLTIGDKEQDTSCITPVLSEFADRIVAEITLAAAITKPTISGGGAPIMFKAMQRRLPSCVMAPDPQFVNAMVYRRVGEKAWSC